MGLSLDLLALSVGNAAILIIGALVWRRNTTSGAARTFFAATIAFTVWLTINYLSIQPFSLETTDFLMRLSYVSGSWLMVAAWLFCYLYPIERKPTPLFLVSWLTTLIVGSIFSFSNLVVQEVTYREDKIFVETGSWYALYGVLLGGLTIAAIGSLWRNYADSDLLRRNQIRYVAFGIGTSATLSITFNVVLVPILGTSWGSVTANVLVILPLVMFLGYALIRHRYTEVHRILSWLFTYTICIGLVIAWLLSAEAILPEIYPESVLAQRIGMVFAASAAIFALQPVAALIRRRADRLFSVGWYDSREFLNAMGATLAGELHLSTLMKSSLDSICTELQVTSGALIAIEEDGSHHKETYGVVLQHHGGDQHFPKSHDIIIADELTGKSATLATFEEQGWRIGIPLETRGRRVGYLYLGIKRHGDIFTPKDISVLQIVSNQLAVAIVSAQAYEQINIFNTTLQKQVAEATTSLRHANQKLQVEDRMKTEFIILTSHNLRTPLSIIKGYISLIGETKLDSNQKKLFSSMQDGADRLSQFIEDLLTIDSIVAGHQLVLQPTKAGDILAPLAKEAKDTARTKEVVFIAEINSVLDETIDANNLRLSGAIRNLIDNAYKFTSQGQVSLVATKRGNKLRISVADTGIGISEQELPHLFSKFHRATSTLQYDYEGEGIGLYLTGLVIKEHGGTISVHSKLGEGSRFVIELPIQN